VTIDKIDKTVHGSGRAPGKPPLYGKFVTPFDKYRARRLNEYKECAWVEIEACRKLRRRKAWRVKTTDRKCQRL